jgi:hypothetical protein
MGGGLLNLSATGTENILLYGQPSGSFWVGTYEKFTNFGIQTFRVDYTGQPALRDAQSTRIKFMIPRNAELVTQTYISIDLPDVYSCLPVGGTADEPLFIDDDDGTDPITFQPYEFQWNSKLGFNAIERVETYIGGHLIDEYTGEHLAMSQERDGDAKQNELLDQMIGNVEDLTDPAKAAFRRMQQVQTAAYDTDVTDSIMVTRMAEGGQMMYSGDGLGVNTTYLKADDYNGTTPTQYPPYVLNSYPNSWPWGAGNTLAAEPPWTSQNPLPFTAGTKTIPDAKNTNNCSEVNRPSIEGRQLIVPLNPWFGRNSKAALPLVALQYADVEIFVTFRPLNEWFTIKKYMPPDGGYTGDTAGDYDVGSRTSWRSTVCNPPSTASGYTGSNDNNALWPIGLQERVAPQNGGTYNYRLAKSRGDPIHRYRSEYYTPDPKNLAVFLNPTKTWDPNIHIIANYVFLDEDEAALFAQDESTYLVRTTHEHTYYGVRSADSVDIETYGLVASLTWRFRRSDVQERNQWLNYTNWRYVDKPNILPMVVRTLGYLSRQQAPSAFSESNEQHILQDLSIWVDGKEREATFNRGVWELLHKYQRSNSGFKAIPGVDFYTFEVKTNPYSLQPSGSFNMGKYRRLTLMFSLLQPPLDPNFRNQEAAIPGAPPIVLPPGATGDAACIAVVTKNFQDNLTYNYDLNVYVEKYNQLVIMNGLAGLSFTR